MLLVVLERSCTIKCHRKENTQGDYRNYMITAGTGHTTILLLTKLIFYICTLEHWNITAFCLLYKYHYNHFRKPSKPINNEKFLLGNPKHSFVTPEQLCEEAGVSVQQDNGVSCYTSSCQIQTELWQLHHYHDHAKGTTRVEFYDHLHSTKYGLVEKIVLSEQSGVFAVIKPLSSASIELCPDPITNAKLPHIHAFKPTRYIYC